MTWGRHDWPHCTYGCPVNCVHVNISFASVVTLSVPGRLPNRLSSQFCKCKYYHHFFYLLLVTELLHWVKQNGGKKGGAPAFLLPVPISGWIRIVMLARAKLIWSWFRFVAGVSNNGTYDRPKKFHNSYSTPFCSSCIFHYTPTISRSVSESDLNIWFKIVYVFVWSVCASQFM